jgi:hypothetical protein
MIGVVYDIPSPISISIPDVLPVENRDNSDELNIPTDDA